MGPYLDNGIRPRSAILTVLGAYIRPLGGWLPIAGLIDLMRELGTDEQSVRASVSRLKRRGITVAERRGGVAGYGMSEDGLRMLAEGDARIYGRPEAVALSEGWVLAVFSVPDSKRADRHLLRSRLSWLGFGNLASAVWIAPWHLEAETRTMLKRHGLEGYVHLFRSHYTAFGDVRELVGEIWNIAQIREKYEDFQRVAAPLLARWTEQPPVGSDAFIDHVTALHMWRPLRFLDPGLPIEPFAEGWPGATAWTTFHDLIERLQKPATAYVQDVMRPYIPSQEEPKPLT